MPAGVASINRSSALMNEQRTLRKSAPVLQSSNSPSTFPLLGMARKETDSGASKTVGRPTAFGTTQLKHVDSRQHLYNAKRDGDAGQTDMTKFLNDETILFFAKFGWDDPERSLPEDVAEPTPEAIEASRSEATEAKRNAKADVARDTDKMRAALVKHVRTVSIHSAYGVLLRR